MKTKILILLLLVCAGASAQFTRQSLGGAPGVASYVRGVIQGDSGIVVISFPDTASANLGPNIKLANGLLIRVFDTLFIRDVATSRWVSLRSALVTAAPGIDSIPYTDSSVCIWMSGVPTCYILNRTVTSLALNYDSTMYLLKNNGVQYDSVLIPQDLIFAGIGMVIRDTAVGFRRGHIFDWVGSGGGVSWSLTGNSGTDPATNFLGTIDSVDLVFRRFNRRAGLISRYNTSFGDSSLPSTSTGNFNTAFGRKALASNTTASTNTAIGQAALMLATTGVGNTAVGSFALDSLTTGQSNTAIGGSSLFQNKTSNNNVAVGVNSLRANTGGFNTAVGTLTLTGNLAGANNTAIGYQAGQYLLGGATTLTLANQSIFVGTRSRALADGQINQIVIGYDVTGLGSHSTVLGDSATVKGLIYGRIGIGTLPDDTSNLKATEILAGNELKINSGKNNSAFSTALGFEALASASGAGAGIAIGYQPLSFNTTGAANIAIGTYQPLYNNTTGSDNIALGRNTLTANTTGLSNVAIGSSALKFNVSSPYNTAVGVLALTNATGDRNAGFGMDAGLGITTGVRNTVIGQDAMFAANGSNNTVLGNRAGYNGSGDGNVFLGYQAGYSSVGNDNLYIANTSTTLPIIYGNFATGALKFAQGYGTGARTGTAAYSLNVDGFGNVIEGAVGGGGGGTYTAGTGLVLQGTQFKIQDTLNGAGTRLMWIPARRAFRAGYTSGTEWDVDQVGNYSAAFGYNTSAYGPYSFAAGLSAWATADGAFAGGMNTKAYGTYAAVFGNASEATGSSSFAAGYQSKATNIASTAVGYQNTASGGYSFATGFGTLASSTSAFAANTSTIASSNASSAFGFTTRASGGYSFATGETSVASGDVSATFGRGTKSKSYTGFVVGAYNDSTNAASAVVPNALNRIFQIGVGTADNARSNAMTVLFNGSTQLNKYGVGTFTGTPAYSLNVDAAGNVIEGAVGGGGGGWTIAAGKTPAINNSITFATGLNTDGVTMTFPSTSASIARTDAANTFAGTQTFSASPTMSSNITLQGKLLMQSTITPAGTTGSQTINRASGSVNIAAAGTTVTVTNNTVAANSLVYAWCMTNDATAYVKNVVVAAGSFVINLGEACTAETKVGFIVMNN